MDNKQILAQIRESKKNSVAYQKAYGINGLESKDEIGGHVGYAVREIEDHVCPSDEFVTSLFEECALGLGFEYERR